MSTAIGLLFDHNRHTLTIPILDAALDVLASEGSERLSQPFSFHIEFTRSELDLGAERLRGRSACFSLQPPPQKRVYLGLPEPEIKPLRT